MQRLLRPALALAMTLTLGACSTGTTTSPLASAAPPVTAAPAASTPASAAPASAAPSAAGGAGACAVSTGAPTVKASIKSFAFSPDPVTAKVGEAIGWTNGDSVGHTVTLDSGACTTDTIAGGTTAGLTFSAAGTYTYHCKIHPTMKGTITITG